MGAHGRWQWAGVAVLLLVVPVALSPGGARAQALEGTSATKALMPTARSDLGVVAASNGKLHAIGGTNGNPLPATEEYTPLGLVAAPTSTPAPPAAARAPVAGDLIIVANDLASVFAVNPTTSIGRLLSTGGNLQFVTGVAVAPNGNIIAVDARCCAGGQGGVISIDPTTGAQTIVSQGGNFSVLTGIAVSPSNDGTVLVVDAVCCSGGAVIGVSPNGAQTVLAAGGSLAGVPGVVGLLALRDTDAFVAVSGGCANKQGALEAAGTSFSGQALILSQGGLFQRIAGIGGNPNVNIYITDLRQECSWCARQGPRRTSRYRST